MNCPESLRVQAFFDREVDALNAAEVERHLEHCEACRQLLRHLEETRTALRRHAPCVQAPPELRARVHSALDAAAGAGGAQRRTPAHRMWRSPTFWWGGVIGAGAAAAAVAIAFLVLVFPAANPVVDAVLGAHVASLMSGHLIDVESTDQHTVKPWFAGRVEVSPAVADFASRGYRLSGGRVDRLGLQRAAVTVYRHGPHIINVYCWAAPRGPLPADATRNGYHMAFWRSGDLAYAAVSDTGWDELHGLERLVQGLGASDAPRRNSVP